jgi:hypothetical protein
MKWPRNVGAKCSLKTADGQQRGSQTVVRKRPDVTVKRVTPNLNLSPSN